MPLHQIVPAAFLPTVVVGIGEEGKAACEQFTRLLGGLDEVRRACVAVLAIEEGELDSAGEIVGSWFEPSPTGAQPEKKPLADLLLEAILGTPQGLNNNTQPARLGVRDAQAILLISNNGYAVPDNMMAVVWVIAPTASAWLEQVVKKLRSSLSGIEQQRQQSRSWIMLALLSPDPKGQKARDEQRAKNAAQPWETFLVGGKNTEPLATFAYLFETRDEKNDFWQHVNDLPFAAAEAIFLFTASGMGTMNEFKASLRITDEARPVTKAPDRMGSFGSTRLQFPRTEAELFCAYRLGSTLMQEWIPKQNAQLHPDESKDQEKSAAEFIANLEKNIDDTAELPRGGPAGRPSPPLSDSSIAEAKGLQGPLRGDNEHIFHLMQRKEVEALVGGKRDRADQMAIQFEKAKDELKQWKGWIRRGWDKERGKLETKIAEDANKLIFEPDRGAARTRVYLNKLHEGLKTKQERMARQRSLREERSISGKEEARLEGYTSFLDRMRVLDAGGSWEEDIPSYEVGAVTAAGPQAWTKPGASPTGMPPQGLPAGQPPALPPRSDEEEIEERLNYRYKWYKRQQPPIGALVGAALLVLPAFLLLALTMFPAHTLLALLIVVGIALLGTVLLSSGYRLYRHLKAVKASEDLRNFYIRVLAHQCERYEDQWRDILMVSFMARVRKMIDRLADWNTFLQKTAEGLKQEADTVEKELFTGAVGRRDALLANKAIMSLQGYNLTAFEQEVSQQRSAGAKAGQADAWMTTTPGILLAMLDTLRGRNTNLLETSSADLRVPIRDFCLGIVRRYLTTPLQYLLNGADGQIALPGEINKDKALITYLLDRSVILYSPADSPPVPSVFLVGRQQVLQNITRQAPSGDMVGIGTRDDEWMGIIRLLPGGALPPFDGRWVSGPNIPPDVEGPEKWKKK